MSLDTGITAYIWCNGDPLIENESKETQLFTCVDEFTNRLHRESVRNTLEICFSKLWDSQAKVLFGDEL